MPELSCAPAGVCTTTRFHRTSFRAIAIQYFNPGRLITASAQMPYFQFFTAGGHRTRVRVFDASTFSATDFLPSIRRSHPYIHVYTEFSDRNWREMSRSKLLTSVRRPQAFRYLRYQSETGHGHGRVSAFVYVNQFRVHRQKRLQRCRAGFPAVS